MKILTQILILTSFNAFAQKELSVEYYTNGNIFSVGYNLKTKLENGGGSILPIGLWQYWYEDGNLSAEVIYTKNGHQKYINMWLPNKSQVLKNGEGFIVNYFSFGGVKDSTVILIKDSIPNGSIRKFRKSENEKKYQLCSEGINVNGKLQGEKWFKNHKLDIHLIENYSGGKKNGEYIRWDDGILFTEGQYCMDEICGEWKFYKNGILNEIKSFKNGKEQGKYLAFHSNGKVKAEGNLIRHHVTQKVSYLNIDTYEETIKEENIETAVKHGLWKTFDQSGKLLKEINYNFGKIISK